MIRGVLALIVICAISHSQERLIGKGVNFYSKEKEAALGAQLAKDVRSRVKMIESDIVRDYVSALGARLAAQAPGDPLPFAFDVMVDRSPAPLNEPYAVPGGQVFVHSGLFLASESEAEFAGMLAHAIAHVAERHGTRSATRGQLVNLASIPLIFAGGWTTPDGSVLVPRGFLQFARLNELEADRLTVQMMARAGFDPAGLIRYIERTQIDKPERKEFSPFPPLEERLGSLNSGARVLPRRTYESSDEFAAVRDEVRRLMERREPEPPSLRRKSPQ